MNSNEQQKVFKFREGNSNDIDAFFEDYIWFSSFSQLNDPYEGVVHFDSNNINDNLRLKYLESIFSKSPNPGKSPKEEAIERYELSGERFSGLVAQKAIESFKSDYQEVRNRNGVFSFSRADNSNIQFPSPLNSMLMWSHYSNGFRGYCVEFDYQKLKESLEVQNESEFAVLNIKYANDGLLPSINLKTYMEDEVSNTHRSPIEILKSFSRKEQSWFYENETRFIAGKTGKHHYDSSAINAVYLSANAPNWLKNSIIHSIKNKHKNIKIYEVLLHESEYKFGLKALNNTN
jgi:hypothetical protein